MSHWTAWRLWTVVQTGVDSSLDKNWSAWSCLKCKKTEKEKKTHAATLVGMGKKEEKDKKVHGYTSGDQG